MLKKSQIKAVVSVDHNVKKIKIPVVYIQHHGVLVSHLRYLVEKRQYSQSWMRKSAMAIILLLDYIEKYNSLIKNPHQLFNGFYKALQFGTNNENGIELDELNWKAREPKDAKNLINHVHQFLEHFLDNNYSEMFSISELLSNYSPPKALSYAAFQHKKNNALMPYLYDEFSGKRDSNRFSGYTDEDPTSNTTIYAFDDELFVPMLVEGFRVRNNSGTLDDWNLRDILITILLHCGGLRESEPFHLFVHDIMEDPSRKNIALVKLYHPSRGRAPNEFGKIGKRFATRQQYLWMKYGLTTRVESTKKSYHAGWKELTLDNGKEGYCYVQWFPTNSGALFLNIWKLYLKTQYVAPGKGVLHPFAFTNKTGGTASLPNYIRAHAIAVNKIGCEVQKEQGTTPQAHRHAYGTRLRKAGLSPILIQKAMHHKVISSQQVYTQPSQKEINEQLSAATSRISSAENDDSLPINLEPSSNFQHRNFYHHQYGSVDPMGIFAPLFNPIGGEK